MSDQQTNQPPLPVGVVGCGRMGKLHARVYSQMPQVKLVGVYDHDADVAAAVADEYGTVAVSIDDLASTARAVTIATPTTTHADAAGRFLTRGIACLIEKPLARDSAEARRIVELAAAHDAPLQVGHIERFNPAVRAMSGLSEGNSAMSPRFIEVVRISPLTFRSIDVGVVLDMMIHDLDIILRLARSPVRGVAASGVSVIGDVEDICNARITFESGCVANVTASRLAMKTERKLRVFSHDAYVSLDYQKRYGIVVQRSGNVDGIQQVVRQIRTGELDDLSQVDFMDLVKVQELKIDDTEPLRAQLDAFVNAVVTGTPPTVTGEDGLAAVELAERIVAAIPAA